MIASDQKPVLCVIAGPNGSGKTTTTLQLLQSEWSRDAVYINPDNIAQQQFGDWNSESAVRAAAEYATKWRYKCLAEGKSFTFETVFSSEEKLDFLQKAKEAGFFVRFFFVCTEDPIINVERITKRYLSGGHEVPISKIINRFYKSLEQAASAVEIVDRAYFYDNSIENENPRLVLRTVDGTTYKTYENPLPEWVKPIVKR